MKSMIHSNMSRAIGTLMLDILSTCPWMSERYATYHSG